MEGAIVDHVRVVLSGEPLYRRPSLDFAPFIYVPGYYYVAAIVTKIIGLGMVAPRIVSLLAIVGCFAAIGVWVYRESCSAVAAAVSVGLFAGTYGLSAFWFDIARCDSLYLFLLLVGYLFARHGVTVGHALVCGVLLGGAVLTKQVGLPLALPALGYAIARSPKLGRWAIAAFAAFVALTMGALEIASGGWFSFYAFRVPADHEIFWKDWRTVLSQHFLSPVMPMMLAAAAVVSGVVARGKFLVWAMHSTWVLAAAMVSFLAILHTGGYPNVLMSFHAALAICAGIVFAALWQVNVAVTRFSAQRFARRVFAVGVVGVQMLLLPAVKSSEMVPSEADRRVGEAMLARVAAHPAPLWMVSSGYYPWVTHHAPVMGHAMAITDVFKSKQWRVKRELLEELTARIRAKQFQTIVLDRARGFLPGEITDEITRNYRLTERLQSESDGRFWPKSGASVRPDEIWEPISP